MNFLGIDIGTGGSRAVVIDEDGVILASATVEHQPFASPEIGWAEQDPNDWRRASAAAIRACLQSENVTAESIAAVGFSGQMHGAVLLDAAGEVLRPALIWCDQRTEKQCAEIVEKIGAERLIELVSNPAITGFTLPKLLWTRKNEPKIWRKVKSILLPKDYVRFCLSGDKASDVADSSGTLLFDVQNRKWSNEMLDVFEIERDLLPKVYESPEITGKISQSGAAETNLKAGTLIVAGAGDNAAGAIGMGVVQAGTISATIGTSGVVFAVTDAPALDKKGRIHTLCHAVPNRWHNTGVTQGAGLSLKWFRENFGAGKSYDELTCEAAKVAVGADGLLWTPYLMGERAPHLDPHARAAFVGFSANHTRAHAVRAVMEGVAFSLRDSLEIFREVGTPVETIRLGGGGARSKLWRQIQADVYGHSVEIIEAEEGAAFGAALLAAVGAGAFDSVEAACQKTIRVIEKIEPNVAAVEILNRSYQAYKMIYPALRPMTEFLRK
ncbi:MAG: xylulokinase [Pyrinomonadaceae bacterium]